MGKILDAVRIPKDVSMGVPLLRMVGGQELLIENYRGILEYTDTCVRIQTKAGQICVNGKRMEVSYYTNDEMKIEGYITELKFSYGG